MQRFTRLRFPFGAGGSPLLRQCHGGSHSHFPRPPHTTTTTTTTVAASGRLLLRKQSYATHRSIRQVGQAQDAGALQNLMRRVMEIDAEINNVMPAEDFKPNSLACKAYCTAEAYDFAALKDAISATATTTTTTDSYYSSNDSNNESHDMMHVEMPQGGEAYVFANGTCVTWAAQDNEEFVHETLGLARVKPIGHITTETMAFTYDQDEPTGLKGGLILLNPDLSPQLAKAAFSYGLARSVKLATIEDMFDQYLDRAQWLKVSRKDLQDASNDLAQLHQHTMSNARDGFLDTPELHWSRPELEGYYTSISQSLDVRPRISILNRKLEHADAQLADLRQNLSERNQYTLQWLVGLVLASIAVCKFYELSTERRKVAAQLAVAEAQVEDDYSVHTPTVVT